MIDNLLPLLFGLTVICVGALALGFIADGLGKFRAPIRKAEKSFDQQPEIYKVGNRSVRVAPEPNLEDLERLRRHITEVYDQEKDHL